MYLWRRRASQNWSDQNEEKLRVVAGDNLAIIEQPNRKQLQFELASNERAKLEKLANRFGGRIEKLPSDWLKRALRRKNKPIRVAGRRTVRIPAGAAFGTGEHATTAMSLKLLERVMRFWEAQASSPAGDRALAIANFSGRNFSARRRKEHARCVRSPELAVDLGTGSGILALAAKCLGARRVIGIDNDPVAISTAKQNAQLNKIHGVSFQVADVRSYKLPPGVDVVTANLFSELLVEILPKIQRAPWLIVSGILRAQEGSVRRALTLYKIELIEVRRRGKWVAILAASSYVSRPFAATVFCINAV